MLKSMHVTDQFKNISFVKRALDKNINRISEADINLNSIVPKTPIEKMRLANTTVSSISTAAGRQTISGYIPGYSNSTRPKTATANSRM